MAIITEFEYGSNKSKSICNSCMNNKQCGVKMAAESKNKVVINCLNKIVNKKEDELYE